MSDFFAAYFNLLSLSFIEVDIFLFFLQSVTYHEKICTKNDHIIPKPMEYKQLVNIFL